jgi:hypothetical protein
MNTLNTQQIEEHIRSILSAIPKQLTWTKNDTKVILLPFGELGEKLGYEVCVVGLPEHFDSGWLFDLCWFSNTQDGKNNLLNLTLVMESELDLAYEKIRCDFQKLLIAKAKFKIFVFKARTKDVANHLKELEQGIHTYQGGVPGEIYLLACYDDNEGEFTIEKVVVA